MQRPEPALSMAILAALVIGTTTAGATDIARLPLALATAKPSLIFGMDDSGSMDFELLIPGTIDGVAYWDPALASNWSNGQPIAGNNQRYYAYLFPDGCGGAGRNMCDLGEPQGQWAAAPTAQFAPLRSSAFNPLYYDPLKRYDPWTPGTVNGTLRTWANADPHAAPANPFQAMTLPLDTNLMSTASNWTFHMLPGMVVPAGASTRDPSTGAWNVVPATFTVPTGAAYDMAMSYYPATYWSKASCTANGTDCVAAPDGNGTLQRYEIKPGVTFPSGRAYADELQNFANWFTYYRRRRWMLAAAMGQAIDPVSGIRSGVVDFNNRVAPTLFDADSTDPTANSKVIVGHFQTNHGSGGTPTRAALKFIGDQFTSIKEAVPSSCQRNAAVIVTDGYAYATPVTPPAYDATKWGSGAPYATTYANTLADIALSYYTNNPRTDLPAGQVPAASTSDPDPAADRNTNLHLNTYAITLGAPGLLWPARTDPYASPAIAWPSPNEDLSPKAIDDLWHATINGRGKMLLTTNAGDTAGALRTIVDDIKRTRAAQSGVAFGNPVILSTDTLAYIAFFNPSAWSGDVTAHAIDPATGTISPDVYWSANTLVSTRNWRTRVIASSTGQAGVALTAAAFGDRIDPNQVYGPASTLVDYVRGDKTNEGSTFRNRSRLMGPDINAEPVVDRQLGIVFATTNEGMVHALDKNTGRELWAYLPGFALADAGAQSQPTWVRQTVLDATPVIATAGARRLLVGGRGTAGPGFYALDVTRSASLTETQLASRALWEFPNAGSTSAQSNAAQIGASVGASLGKPLVVNSAKYGWVVLLTSGYNSTRDGKGRLFVLDAATGAVRAEIATPAGSLGAGDAGLAQVSAFVEAGGTVRYAYGGDLLGNLWRFDIDGGSVLQMATLLDAQGNALPVTAAPELGTTGGRRIVYVGTGRLLGSSDLGDNGGTNSVFAIWDDGTAGLDLRARLAARTLSLDGTTRHVSGPAINWNTQRGWVLDLPAGEKANTDPTLALGILTWTTNRPSLDACSIYSVLYAADAVSGLELPPTAFPDAAWFGVTLSGTLASRAALARLADGSLVDVTHQSDTTMTRHRLLVAGSAPPRKAGWREIRR